MGQIDINGTHCFDDVEAKMEKLSDDLRLFSVGDLVDELLSTRKELATLRADAETSQNHNAAVIDLLIAQLRDAGYTGTLSEMVGQACDIKKSIQEKLTRAFELGENWGVSYQGWFTPTKEDHKRHTDEMLEKLLPVPPKGDGG